ncbi:MAG: DoxX family protein [Tepidisphaeraceae bacterium]|jgi:putative oxidoreductase
MTTQPAPTAPRTGSPIITCYSRFAQLASKLQSPLLLLIRVYIGYQCMISGYAHITHFQNTVEAFKGWNIPMPEINVAFSAITEMAGGGLLFLGLAARLISIPLIGNFLVAFLAVNLSDPHYHQLLRNFWNNQDVLLKDDAFPFLMTAILILVFGPGWFSIDGLIRFLRRKK